MRDRTKSGAARWAAAGLLPAFLLSGAAAAAPGNAAAQMKKLDFLLGRWRGSGYIEFMPGHKETFRETERVQARLGGMLVLIQGQGKSEMAPGQWRVTHSALAVVTYDPQSGAFRWQAYNAEGPRLEYADTTATVQDGVVHWGYAAGPAGRFRFAFHLDAQGRWVETGEMSHDGRTWRPFFAMTLRRVK